MDEKNNKTENLEEPLLDCMKRIETVPAMTTRTRKDSENRPKNYVEFSGAVSTLKVMFINSSI